MTTFDLQWYLEHMENRIRADIAEARADIKKLDDGMLEVSTAQATTAQKVDTMEKQLGWIWTGVGMAFLGLLGTVGAWIKSKIGVS